MPTDKKEKSQRNFIASALFGIPVILITSWLYPGFIPFSTADIWSWHGKGVGDWVLAAWPIFVWGFVATVLQCIFGDRGRGDTGYLLVRGFFVSIWAGVAEELAFRWSIFLASMVYLYITNLIFFEWLFDFGLVEWLHIHVFGALANWVTFGKITALTQGPWYVGAALLASNAFFRDGHKYLGPVGILNSWFLGMYFFYLTLNYGLLSAIAVHFAYDLIIFTVAAFFGKK